MYSNKENINKLTSLLVSHEIETAVVCPGSRNAPIVHNLNEHPNIKCYPVTDERSAGFYALGLAQATQKPVVVCVTSGSALLNLAPAVAEAYYQHLPLVVVSADRPQAWINQLDGQTLPQPNAFGKFVGRGVNLPEPKDDTERWYCNRLINEALDITIGQLPCPVHINVPISEPLFEFSVSQLPTQRIVKCTRLGLMNTKLSDKDVLLAEHLFSDCSKPMIVLGQIAYGKISQSLFDYCSKHVVILAEPLSQEGGAISFDEILHAVGPNPNYMPDKICYIGDTVVSKRLRKFLRKSEAKTVMLTLDDAQNWSDPTQSISEVIKCPDWHSIELVLRAMLTHIDGQHNEFYQSWNLLLHDAETIKNEFVPKYSQMAVVKYFEEQLEDFEIDYFVHYANSSAVRLANIYATHYVWCNRGVNGIEGSLSTVAGFSLAQEETDRVFCVIGDLSFFYDQNALWNQNLKGNLRIILLNNHGGGIFSQLKGLSDSPAADSLVSAVHTSDAQGICTQNDIGYLKATNMEEMQIGMVTLMTRDANRPMLLEVITKCEDDAEVLKSYYEKISNRLNK